MLAIIKGDEQSELRAGVKKSLAIRVFAYHSNRMILGNAIGATCKNVPAFAIVVGAENVGRKIIHSIAKDGP